MRYSSLFVVCMTLCVSLTIAMRINSHYPHYDWDTYDKKPMPVPVVYKKVDSVLPVLLSLVLSQFFRSSTSFTDTETLRENGITVITENPCC